MKKNNFISYAVKLPTDELYAATFLFKRDAITHLTGYDIDNKDRSAEWRKYYYNGWRVVKVLVTEI